MKYEHITIEQRGGVDKERFAGKPVYKISNNKSGEQIGLLSYYQLWRQYVFSSQAEFVFNNTCLRDIINFIEEEAGKE